MAQIKKVTDAEIKKARRAGVKTRKPKKPRKKTVASMEGYIDRYNAWVERIKEGVKKFNQNESDKTKSKTLKSQISRL